VADNAAALEALLFHGIIEVFTASNFTITRLPIRKRRRSVISVSDHPPSIKNPEFAPARVFCALPQVLCGTVFHK
jgi:hypothetical protein